MTDTGTDRVARFLRFDEAVGQRQLRGLVDQPIVVFARPATVLAEFVAETLDDAERAQAERFRRRQDADSYLAAHYLARNVLATTIGTDAASLDFIRLPGEKPRLAGGNVDFSISHCQSWVAIAVCQSGKVGVDVEAQRPSTFWNEYSRSFVAPEDIDLTHLRYDPWHALKLWTAKEATVKASGCGFSVPPNKVPIHLEERMFRAWAFGASFHGSFCTLDDNHMLAIAIED